MSQWYSLLMGRIAVEILDLVTQTAEKGPVRAKTSRSSSQVMRFKRRLMTRVEMPVGRQAK